LHDQLGLYVDQLSPRRERGHVGASDNKTIPQQYGTYPQLIKKKGLTKIANPLTFRGGDDETRTRDLLRDRQAF
jgi:hypothetical protein